MTIFQRHHGSRNVIYRQGKNIIVGSKNPELATEVDGDPGPDVPVRITVIPKAVRMMVPEGARPAGIRAQILRALK
jgi:diacylglycerol kinase family enzyme